MLVWKCMHLLIKKIACQDTLEELHVRLSHGSMHACFGAGHGAPRHPGSVNPSGRIWEGSIEAVPA